ncbi:MAG: bifunctional alpha,alpha-trehalose-phosphate synthase (UDP-forming)/trehalose-phosphatase [Peptostreptococcaceae bacterium]|nr:bifunctional alpha,alpha-trehalose-phosphate synthase (UDP-forming)/trehalose-phosphatase [Peptostreptococcaceae bacterium]
MSKMILISNRLPVTIKKDSQGFEYESSVGGLATGLKSYHEHTNSIWVGWPGITNESLSSEETIDIRQVLDKQFKCLPVFMSELEIEEFYYGFCNKTIWPLFHYFTNKTEYDLDLWEAYVKVNKKFFDVVEPLIENGDTIWIHDYQLMLLPQMIKEKHPNTKIGFFLHIPFPSYEIFRLLVWRDEILQGLLGADLIGFHTYEYVRHFLSSVRRLLGFDNNLNHIIYEDRNIHVDAFPMGIDHERFAKEYDTPEFLTEVRQIKQNTRGEKIILSVDRLDYTKGIPEKIRAFDEFLCKYPEYKGKVRFHLIVAPSRIEVDTYENLKSEIDELVSQINGKHATVSWMPIWFYFQSFSQESLIALYKHADVLLATPLRDGMNLVAKEYIAARTDYKGMVVISETAGVASEIGEVVVVNANDCNAIVNGIKTALEMPTEEKIAVNRILNKRLKRYNVEFWADQFINSLSQTTEDSKQSATKSIDRSLSVITDAYKKASKRMIFLDYDGTLVGFESIPQQAKPDIELKRLLFNLVEDPKNTVVIVSGRDRFTLESWLGDLRLYMIAAHGLWRREPDGEWVMTATLDNSWKANVESMMQMYTDRMPGALIEEKDYSLAFHYRQCEPDMVSMKLGEVRAALESLIQSNNLSIQEGNKVIEVKDSRVDKGQSASAFLQNQKFDFILAVGDDYTDEDLFMAMPSNAHTIKIGTANTNASFRLNSWKSMRSLLKELTNTKEN